MESVAGAAGSSADGRKLLVAVATYNEMGNLPSLVEEVFRWAPEADLLVVDDNSPDGTGRWCDEASAVDRRIHCQHRPAKLGLGSATIAALRYGITHDYDLIINMDADLSHDPRDIPRLLAALDEPGGGIVDVVIGSRYVDGGRIEGWSRWRHAMSRAVNAYARGLLGLAIRDCSGAFRCYRVDALKRLDFDRFRSEGYSVLEELLWALKNSGCRAREVPIVFVNRRAGRSKINLREAIRAVWVIFLLGCRGGRGKAASNG